MKKELYRMAKYLFFQIYVYVPFWGENRQNHDSDKNILSRKHALDLLIDTQLPENGAHT